MRNWTSDGWTKATGHLVGWINVTDRDEVLSHPGFGIESFQEAVTVNPSGGG